MKSKFIREGKQIYYQDKQGRKWNKKCIDELFDAITKRERYDETVDYYTYDEETEID